MEIREASNEDAGALIECLKDLMAENLPTMLRRLSRLTVQQSSGVEIATDGR